MVIKPRRARPDSYTKILIHSQGANGSVVFRDSSQSGHVITANGNVQISTGTSKFSPVSMYFDGTGDYLSMPDSDDWNFGSGLLTIDTWAYFLSIDSGGYHTFVVQRESYPTASMQFFYAGASSLLRISYNDTAIISQSWTPSLNTWYHIAFIRGWGGNANDWALTVDGAILGTVATTNPTLGDYAAQLEIGAGFGGSVGGNAFNGYIDELRISKGIARWTSNFTPPTRRY